MPLGTRWLLPRLCAAAAALVALAAAPSPALAGEIGMDGGAMTFTGAPGEDNDIGLDIERDDSGDAVGMLLYDSWTVDIPASARAAGCKYREEFSEYYEPGGEIYEPNVVRCPLQDRMVLDLGDADDRLDSEDFYGPLGGADEYPLPVTADGGPGDDYLSGGLENDRFEGGDGADTLAGRLGDDELLGQAGDDDLVGHEDDDLLDGGEGDDELEAILLYFGSSDTLGGDTYAGGPGYDNVSWFFRSENISATFDGQANDGAPGEGDNVGSDVEELLGGSGDDTIVGDDGPQRLNGSSGDDTISGGGGDDYIDGDDGDDALSGDAGDDRVEGDDHSDEVTGGTGADELVGDDAGGTSGLDTMHARDGEGDLVLCGGSTDTAIVDEFDNVETQGGFACESVDLQSAGSGSSGGDAGAGSGGTSSGGGGAGQTGSAIGIPSGQRIAAILRGGLRVSVPCASACTVSATLLVSKRTARTLGLGRSRKLGSATRTLRSGGAAALRVKPSRRAAARLRRARKVPVIVRIQITQPGAPKKTVNRRMTLRR